MRAAHASGRGSEQSAQPAASLCRDRPEQQARLALFARYLLASQPLTVLPLPHCLDRHSLLMLPYMYIWPAWCCSAAVHGSRDVRRSGHGQPRLCTHARDGRRRRSPSGNELLGATAHLARARGEPGHDAAFPCCVCSRQVCGEDDRADEILSHLARGACKCSAKSTGILNSDQHARKSDAATIYIYGLVGWLIPRISPREGREASRQTN